MHVFNVGDIGGKPLKMALTQVSDEKRAQLAFWRFMYEHEADSDDPWPIGRVQAELRAQMALAASAGAAGVTCGAYFEWCRRRRARDRTGALREPGRLGG